MLEDDKMQCGGSGLAPAAHNTCGWITGWHCHVHGSCDKTSAKCVSLKY